MLDLLGGGHYPRCVVDMERRVMDDKNIPNILESLRRERELEEEYRKAMEREEDIMIVLFLIIAVVGVIIPFAWAILHWK